MINKTVIGVIGGMGPEATVRFYANLIKATKAKSDQDHYHIIIDSNSKIPDRTEAILNGGLSPLKPLIETAQRLQNFGVKVGCIPCITAHYFHEQIQREVNYKILHAIKEVDYYLKAHYENVKKIGVLCTTGTKKMKLFDTFIDVDAIIYPDDRMQENLVMQAIYGKAGIKERGASAQAKTLLVQAAECLIKNGAELIVAGCTEIPLALKSKDINVPYIDTMNTVINTLLTLD